MISITRRIAALEQARGFSAEGSGVKTFDPSIETMAEAMARLPPARPGHGFLLVPRQALDADQWSRRAGAEQAAAAIAVGPALVQAMTRRG